MSIFICATVFALTLAQLFFWESLRDMFGAAATISMLGLFASITLILTTLVAATHPLFDRRGR